MVRIAIHGGAGGDGPWKGPTDLDPQRISCIREVLERVGLQLKEGLDALEAVTLAVEMLEDEPLFNAGKGSVLSAEGSITMDASIMRGCDLAAGSVVGVNRIKNPIRAANLLLQRGWPVMLNSDAADTLAISSGVEEVSQEWLKTDLRIAQWEKWKLSTGKPGSTDEDDAALDHDMGTVGAVALDSEGRLAAATSTGGMTGKPDGRIGDTPIIGAGTWCDGNVAVSCTGIGEAYIRTCAAHSVASKMENGLSLVEACEIVLDSVAPLGGRGGIIAVDLSGNVVMPFQTTLMYRGSWVDGEVTIGIGPGYI